MISYPGPRIADDIEESLFSKLQPTRTTLSLDFFTVKMLMQRFAGLFLYEWIEESNENQFTLKFNRVTTDEPEPIVNTEFTETSDH